MTETETETVRSTSKPPANPAFTASDYGWTMAAIGWIGTILSVAIGIWLLSMDTSPEIDTRDQDHGWFLADGWTLLILGGGLGLTLSVLGMILVKVDAIASRAEASS